MKLIKYKNRIGFLLFIIMLGSCKKDSLLNKYPLDGFSEPTYFKTEADLQYFANSFYDGLPEQLTDANDNNSDNMVPGNINSFLAGTSTIPSIGGGWATDDWADIRNTNYFLQRYTRADVANKELYAGEVRFFRAFFYWQKVKRFGAVPLLLKDLTETSGELYGPREPHEKVMDQVLQDLNFAVANLPEKSAAAAGRLHKDAANALKSRICLWEGTFRKYHGVGDANVFLTEAATASEAVMNSAYGYALYNTGDPNQDYRNVFIQPDLSIAAIKESILSKTYLANISTHGYTRTAGENSTGLSKDAADAYLFKDGKPIGLTSFSYSDATPTDEAANRDPRYAQTIATPGFVWTLPALAVTLPAIGSSQTSTGYWNIKGRSSDPNMWIANNDITDKFIFRYAEVLLNYAEAKYELQGTISQTDLDNSINLIRARAGVTALTTSPAADPNAVNYGYTVAPLLYEIRRERRIELMGEGFRFDDILRWKAGKLIENPKTILGMKLTDALKAQYTSNVSAIQRNANQYIIVYPSITSGSRTWNDKLYLFPLPTEQITLSKYTQNPGWQ